MLISVLVFLTTHSKNQEIPTRISEADYVIFIEKESQKKNPTAGAAEGLEDRGHHNQADGVVASNQPTVGDEADQSNPRKIEDSVPPNAQLQKFTTKESKEFIKLAVEEPNLSSPVLDPLPASKKNIELNTERLLANDSYTEFLTRIERQTAKFDPKPLTGKSGFLGILGGLLQDNGRENNSAPNTKGPATSCSVKALQRQAPLLDKIPPGHYDKPGSNQAIRISDLVGHGRYVQPSMSVRVSDLLRVGSQLTQIRRPNVSVTVSDLLRQHGSGFQSFCQ